MIKPTIGRVVWYHPEPNMEQPNAALVSHVWSDTCVNLSCFDANGSHYIATSVPLVQDEDSQRPRLNYCEWMPYQKGQAAKQDEVSIHKIAKVCHEVNRAYCESIGDGSQPTWEGAPEWQKLSSCSGVQLQLDNPDLTPEQRHESWFAEKSADGWLWGEVKDTVAKLNPCCVPYSELPVAQQTKDYLFSAVVRSML